MCCCVFVWYGWCVMCKTQTSSESSSDDEGLLDDSIWLLAAGVVDVVVVVVAFVAIEVVLLDLLLVDKLLLLFSLFFFFWTRDDDLEHLSDCRLGFSALSEESASKSDRLAHLGILQQCLSRMTDANNGVVMETTVETYLILSLSVFVPWGWIGVNLGKSDTFRV